MHNVKQRIRGLSPAGTTVQMAFGCKYKNHEHLHWHFALSQYKLTQLYHHKPSSQQLAVRGDEIDRLGSISKLLNVICSASG